MAKKVLVAGAAGFVGANLVRRLLDEGHDVTALVRDPVGSSRLEEIAGHISVRPSGNIDWVREAGFDWVFHLAAAGAYSWQTNALSMVDTNVRFTAEILQLTESAEAFVYAGSSSEYGYKPHAPHEGELPEPNSVYSATKLGGTALCQEAGKRLQRPTITARLYSVYGPFEDARRFIPTLIREGLENQLPNLVDPDIARDYIYVSDVCDALLLLASGPWTDPKAIYNIGTGVETTIRDAVGVARQVLGIGAEPAWGSMGNREWDTVSWVADPFKMKTEFSWSAPTTFSAGFSKAVDWYRANLTWLEVGRFR